MRPSVVIDECEGLLVQLQTFDRAAERHPKFLVEVGEVQQVGAGFERHLVEATGAEKFPAVIGRDCGSGEHGINFIFSQWFVSRRACKLAP